MYKYIQYTILLIAGGFSIVTLHCSFSLTNKCAVTVKTCSNSGIFIKQRLKNEDRLHVIKINYENSGSGMLAKKIAFMVKSNLKM